MENAKLNKRVEWIDILKGIGIIYVVIGHANNNQMLSRYINSFHMPLFFLISGYLFNHSKYENIIIFIKKKFKTLILPYCIFAIIGMVFQFSFREMLEIQFYKRQVLYGIITTNGIWNGPIWFLVCLFFVEILYYLLTSQDNKYIQNIGVLLFSLIGYLLSNHFEVMLIWRLNTAFTALLFFHIGNIFKTKKNLNLNIAKAIIISISAFLISIFVAMKLNTLVIVSRGQYGNYFYFHIAALAGVIFYITLSKAIDKIYILNKILSYLGKNSIVIMSLHWIPLVFIPYITREQFNYTPNMFIRTIMVLIVLLPFIAVINSYFPCIIGKPRNKRHSQVLTQ